MEYLKEEIFEMLNLGEDNGHEEYKKAYQMYLKANKKAMKKLPKSFVKTYETIGFHDALIPKINISTAYQGFNRNEVGNRTHLELALIKFSRNQNNWQGWMILFENIRKLVIDAESERKSLTCFETFHHDELLLAENMFLSWEINAIQAHLKIEFKTLTIRDLSEYEINQYASNANLP